LTAAAWRQLHRSWHPRCSFVLAWQSIVAGSLFSALNRLQTAIVGRRRAAVPVAGGIVIIGYWRSGTTLLHELLCCDERYTFASTASCMNPHSFILTHGAGRVATGEPIQRPMDEMAITRESPQEDEFALLALGARSPYEALLFPERLAEALELADPANLSHRERAQWQGAFREFLAGVSLIGGGRPIILKSPAHSYRVAILREALPQARFVLIVRDPYEVFESAVRMWRSLMALYALTPALSEDEIRRVLLVERPRFEARLMAGIVGLPPNRFATLRYEQLVADPVGTIDKLYAVLELGDFAAVRPAIVREVERRKGYEPRAQQPPAPWRQEIAAAWADIFRRYDYPI
jgi:omega-hydroxy-beta-dihydromenaquinone-9 sulfotransferase